MEFERSEVSFTPMVVKSVPQQVIFNATKENPAGINLGLDNTYIPILNQEEEFFINADKLSFKQRGKIEDESHEYKKESEFEKLKQKAIEKISKMKLKKENESEEEEESSSYSSSYEENESKENSDFISSKEKIEIKSEINSQQEQTTEKEKNISQIEGSLPSKEVPPNIEKEETHKQEGKHHGAGNKHKDDDFYHVNADKITLFLYNYNTGFVQTIKDPKFKVSQVIFDILAKLKIKKEIINRIY